MSRKFEQKKQLLKNEEKISCLVTPKMQKARTEVIVI